MEREKTITTSIENLFCEYRTNPLALMREIGIQARLHRLLQDQLTEADKTCRVQIKVARKTVHTGYSAERVQMEVRVTDADGNGATRSDIVVLRSTQDAAAEPITLTRYPNGAFDIVSKIKASDIAAVIEVKAACSADLEQRHRFRRDLEKLLELAETCRTGELSQEFHFVLIDKSVAISNEPPDRFGHVALEAAKPTHHWHEETDDSLRDATDRAIEKFWKNSPKVTVVDERESLRQIFVHVWEMAHENGRCTSTLRHRYAVCSDSPDQQRLAMPVAQMKPS